MEEFRAGLALATDQELRELIEILFQPKFNPLDYVNTPKLMEVKSYDRTAWIDRLEQRFQFLAADGLTVLQGQTDQVQYRQVLINTCQQLRIAYNQKFSTLDLESEIFLTLIQKTCKKLPPRQYTWLNRQLQASIARSSQALQLPEAVRKDPLRLVLTGGGALALNSVVRPWLLSHLSRQITLHLTRLALAKQALAQGGTVAAQWQARWMAGAAGRGVALNMARYGVVRGFLAVLGPALWAWFFADLGWRTIATNYSRIIPTIFTLAQIRLTRMEDSDLIERS